MKSSNHFNDDNDAVAYIEAELAKAMLPGWTFWLRVQNQHLEVPDAGMRLCDKEWKICRDEQFGHLKLSAMKITDLESAGVPMKYYALRISADLRIIYITFGNTDAGPLTIRNYMPRAVVIETADLEQWSLAEMIRDLMSQPENYPINAYGYS